MNSVAEARYLVGILNSSVLLEIVKPFQAVGLFGPRHFDKNVFRAPIVPYDEHSASHAAIAACVEAIEGVVSEVDLSQEKTFVAARKKLRQLIGQTEQGAELEALVAQVLAG